MWFRPSPFADSPHDRRAAREGHFDLRPLVELNAVQWRLASEDIVMSEPIELEIFTDYV